MTTPEQCTFTFKGASGRLYTVDGYVSDAAAAAVTFNPNGSAGSTSPQYWRCPEMVTLVDYSQVTGTGVAVGIYMTRDGAIVPGTSMRFANQLNSLAFRPALKVDFPAGALIGATQF